MASYPMVGSTSQKARVSQLRLVRSSKHCQLFVRSERPDVVELQIHWVRSKERCARPRHHLQYGPLRSCRLVIDALTDAVLHLDGQATPKDVLKLARRIDRRLCDRLIHFQLLRAGRYAALADHVRFSEEHAEPQWSSHLHGWIAAELSSSRTDANAQCGGLARDGAARHALMLTRNHDQWELWLRRDSAYFPHRTQLKICSTDILPDEPRLVAELLVRIALQGTGLLSRLVLCEHSLIRPERLNLLLAEDRAHPRDRRAEWSIRSFLSQPKTAPVLLALPSLHERRRGATARHARFNVCVPN